MKTVCQLSKDKWAKERKCYTTRIEEQCEELKRRAEELEETRRFQRQLETTLEAKKEESCQIRRKQRETAQTLSKSPCTRGNNRTPSRTTYSCPIKNSLAGSVPGNTKFHRKHEDVFRGARGTCHRAKGTYFEWKSIAQNVLIVALWLSRGISRCHLYG